MIKICLPNDDSNSLTQPKPITNRLQRTDFGNLSTSRVMTTTVPQFNVDDYNPDSSRSRGNKEFFKKIQNLEFQNDLFQLQMSHISKRKNVEDNLIKNQLYTLQHEINGIRARVLSGKSITTLTKPQKFRNDISLDSEKSSDSSSSSSFLSYEGLINKQTFLPNHINSNTNFPLKEDLNLNNNNSNNNNNNDNLLNRFKSLFDTCKIHERLSTLFSMYCGSLKTIEIDLQNNNLCSLIDNTVRMLIDLINKFNSVKLDNILYKDITPDKNSMNFEFETFNKEKRLAKQHIQQDDSLSPVFNSNDELSDMRIKLSDQYDRLEWDSKDSNNANQLQNQKPNLKQQQRPPKLNTPVSNSNYSNNTLDQMKSGKSSRRPSKTTRIDLMPSLKSRKIKE